MSMPLPKKVLVGVAFPDDPFEESFCACASDAATVQQAKWYAKAVGGELRFVSIIEGKDHKLPYHDSSLHDAYAARMEPELGKLVDGCAADGIPATYALTKGTAWRELIMQSQAHGDEMIMVANRRSGTDALDQLLHGSTARRLLRKSPVPVWVFVPTEGDDDHPKARQILVPVDFSEVSYETVDIANQLASFAGSERLMLHCPDYSAEWSLQRLPDADEKIAEFRAEIAEKVEGDVQDVLGEARDDWHVLIGNDWVVRVMPDIIEKRKVDLVIMATVARTGIVGFFVGNTAEKLLNRTTCSVLVIKPRGWRGVVN